MHERNLDIPIERRIEFRIGINVGDVMVERDDIYGDAVNVAARLEALATPGTIWISQAVRDQVIDKLDLPFVDMGEHHLKNIHAPSGPSAFRWVHPASSHHPPCRCRISPRWR